MYYYNMPMDSPSWCYICTVGLSQDSGGMGSRLGFVKWPYNSTYSIYQLQLQLQCSEQLQLLSYFGVFVCVQSGCAVSNI